MSASDRSVVPFCPAIGPRTTHNLSIKSLGQPAGRLYCGTDGKIPLLLSISPAWSSLSGYDGQRESRHAACRGDCCLDFVTQPCRGESLLQAPLPIPGGSHARRPKGKCWVVQMRDTVLGQQIRRPDAWFCAKGTARSRPRRPPPARSKVLRMA